MANIVAALVLLAIVGFAAGYVIYSRKKGRKCIGCPDSGCCGKNEDSACSGSCGSCSGCCGGNH